MKGKYRIGFDNKYLIIINDADIILDDIFDFLPLSVPAKKAFCGSHKGLYQSETILFSSSKDHSSVRLQAVIKAIDIFGVVV